MPSHLPDPSRNQKLSAAVGQGLKKGPQINSTNDLRDLIPLIADNQAKSGYTDYASYGISPV